MDEFLSNWLNERVKQGDHKLPVIAASLDEKIIKQTHIYVVFETFSEDDKQDLALDTLSIIQRRKSELNKFAIEYLFKNMLSFDNLHELDDKGFVLAENALKNGFKPCSDGLIYKVDANPQDSDEVARIISKALSVVDVKKEDVVIKSKQSADFNFRYYSLLSLSDLLNIHDNNIDIDERSIFDTEIRNQFSNAVYEKKKKANLAFKNNNIPKI